MITVAYFDTETGVVSRLLSGPSLIGMPTPPEGEAAIVTSYIGGVPAFYDGLMIRDMPDRPSPAHVWSRSQAGWTLDSSKVPEFLSNEVRRALEAIDESAGQARLRYITSVPGQAETYTRKEEQARGWAAVDFAGPPPSFIAAEAGALGKPPQDVANEVIRLADYWSLHKGPEIEGAHLAGKAAVRAATNHQQLLAAEHQAVQVLLGL